MLEKNDMDLSLSETISLLYVDTVPAECDLPVDHAEKFVGLGLAEVSEGLMELTPNGRDLAHRIVFANRPDIAMRSADMSNVIWLH